eukprot:2428592-Rhodomonas_salina.1
MANKLPTPYLGPGHRIRVALDPKPYQISQRKMGENGTADPSRPYSSSIGRSGRGGTKMVF